ncbi:MAG: type I secretion system permease/ATPase [Pseudomonadota bacterium]
MAEQDNAKGRQELKAGMRKARHLFIWVGLFSFFANLLMLTGPIFMLQVYDRVLSSRSEATLVALFGLVIFLYAMMGFMDYARGRVLARVGARFQSLFDRRVFEAILRRSMDPNFRNRPALGLRDLESVQRLYSSPALLALFDMPWTPVFIAAIFIFHPMLGWLAIAGGSVLVVATFLNQWLTKEPQLENRKATAISNNFADQIRMDAEVVQSLGMRQAVLDRWQIQRDESLRTGIKASDVGGSFTNFTKAFRFFLQSAMLAAGAYFVLLQELTPGAMIAGSILLGRALAPIEQSIGQWPMVQQAQAAWASLAELLEKTPVEEEKTALPKPRARIAVEGVSVAPPGDKTATLRNIKFSIQPGQALGVIGQSASGKSTLARVLTGIWTPQVGTVRLDGAALEQYEDDVLGSYIGYLPQDVTLFDATVADNIARLSKEPDAEAIVAAAKKAGAHEMIVGLPDGYDTRISAGGSRLSGGQKQRLGLARALYGDPVLLVLDEPNANLDAEGSNALNRAIEELKAQGNAVVIMAHRPSGIAMCDLLLVLESGQMKAFGPRDEVLKETVKNYQEVAPAIKSPGTAAQVEPPKRPRPAQTVETAIQPISASMTRPIHAQATGAPVVDKPTAEAEADAPKEKS